MPYKLTLTASERGAIDWVGYRYSNGDELYKLLWGPCQQSPDDADWDDPRDITFSIPEYIAWQIAENADQEEGRFPCFADELVDKMEKLIGQIV